MNLLYKKRHILFKVIKILLRALFGGKFNPVIIGGPLLP